MALGLLALVLSTSSCNSKRKVELEDFQLYNSQITGFALSTADKDMKEALAKAAFVIRNTETGRIYNPQALPYRPQSSHKERHAGSRDRGDHCRWKDDEVDGREADL